MITYKNAPSSARYIAVYLDGRISGWIKRSRVGKFYYQPKGSILRGESFDTLAEVKQSIEGS